MSGDSWIGIALVAVALAVAVAATAVETGVVFISRMRVRTFTSRGLPQAESIDDYIRDRYELLGALAIARDLALVLGIATSVFIVLRETESTWLALALTMMAALLVLAVLTIADQSLAGGLPGPFEFNFFSDALLGLFLLPLSLGGCPSPTF